MAIIAKSSSFRFVPFFACISKTVNNQRYNLYIFEKIFSRSIQKGIMGCSIDVYRFKDKCKKKPFFAFISKSVNNQCYNPYFNRKIFSRYFKKIYGLYL